MKAKSLAPLLALACLLALPARAQVNYAISGGIAYVTNSANASGDIVIASSYNGYPVTKIGLEAFAYCFRLTSVTIPDSVTTIEGHAFRDCTGLTNVTIGNSVTDIGSSAFGYCSGLTTVTIPNSVTNIGRYAFSHCWALTNVSIGNSVITIEDGAFNSCARLTSVTIPDSVTSLGISAFASCTGLTNATFSSVTSIRDFTFSHCASLTSMTLPNGVTNIGAFAFALCTALTNVTIPNSVSAIELAAFHSCTALANVTLPSVTNIGGSAFRDCTSLVNVTFPSAISIGPWAFENCTVLTNVTIPNSVTNIWAEAFRDCTSLASVTIPNGVIGIGREAFRGCSSLTNISVDAGNSVYYSLDGVLFGRMRGNLIVCPAGRRGNYVIPDGVIIIEPLAFYYCTRLTSVTIPNSVASIGAAPAYPAFAYCTSLTNFSVGAANSTYSSLDGVLFDKTRTTLITFPAARGGTYVIPSSVTTISEDAFLANSTLTSLTIPGSVTRIESVPSGTSLTNFSVDPGNSVYSSLDGVLFDKTQTALLRFPGGRGGDYVIPSSVTTIGSAFRDCSTLTSLTIPASVISMDTYAFSSCTSLTNISVDAANSRYRSLDGVLFNKSQTWLLRFPAGRRGSYIMPNGVTFVDHYAFFSSTSLTSVTIPGSVDSFGISAFSFSTRLTNITFLGNAPYTSNSFENVGMSATVYYYYGTTGWGPSYDGLPTVMLGAPAPQVGAASAGVKQGGFGFTVAGVVDQTIVVEASTNLVTWQPVWTNTLSAVSTNFIDRQWLNHPRRFYRMRSN